MATTSKKRTQSGVVLKVKAVHADAVTPKKATAGSAGFDLYSVEEVTLAPRQRAVVDTGLSLEIPVGYEGQVRPRSGLAARQGITVLNSPGTIDSDYRGVVKVILYNTGPLVTLKKGERIAQLVLSAVPKNVRFEEVEGLSETDRGEGGFGSTGA